MKYCSNCGTKLDENSNFCSRCGEQNIDLNNNFNKNIYKNKKQENKKTSTIVAVAIVLFCIYFGVKIGLEFTSKNKDFVDYNQYQALDIQALHNDYVDNEITAKSKYKGNYYYFVGTIYDIEEFLGDKYLEIRYTSDRDASQTIEFNAYFDSASAFAGLKKGDTVTVYCKFEKRLLEDYFGIATYSFHSCRIK